MIKFSSFKKAMNEEFNLDKAVKDALKWMTNKYGKDLYNFKHIENMNMDGDVTKTYDINVDNNTYILNLKKFDSTGDGELDALGFDVLPAHDEPEEELGDEDKDAI